MANTIGEKELKTNWPVEDGITAGTTRDWDNEINLVAEEGSVYPRRKKVGL